MDCILLKAGGGGVGSDELTATASNVLTGTKYVGADTNDEAGTGTMADKSGSTQSATATLDSTNKRVQLTVPATGKYDTNAKLFVDYATLASLLGVEAAKMLTTENILGVQGTIGSKAAATYYATTSDQTISAGQYLGGAQTIKKLTQTNLAAGNIKKGVTITINNGNANVWSVAGSLAVTSAINFSAAALSGSSIRISWTNPSKGPWEGVFIQMSTSGNPGVSGGTRVYTGRGNSTTAGGSNYVDITGLSVGTTYYFTCTSYATGLGNGASYNVSAKTKGFVLFGPGNNAAGLAPYNTGASSYYVVYDNYIHLPKTNSAATQYQMKGTTTFSVNLSGYSALKWKVKCTGYGGGLPIYHWPQIRLHNSSNNTFNMNTIYWDNTITTGQETIISRALTSTEKTYTITDVYTLAMQAYCEDEDENGTQPWAGYIYQIWFE